MPHPARSHVVCGLAALSLSWAASGCITSNDSGIKDKLEHQNQLLQEQGLALARIEARLASIERGVGTESPAPAPDEDDGLTGAVPTCETLRGTGAARQSTPDSLLAEVRR